MICTGESRGGPPAASAEHFGRPLQRTASIHCPSVPPGSDAPPCYGPAPLIGNRYPAHIDKSIYGTPRLRRSSLPTHPAGCRIPSGHRPDLRSGSCAHSSPRPHPGVQDVLTTRSTRRAPAGSTTAIAGKIRLPHQRPRRPAGRAAGAASHHFFPHIAPFFPTTRGIDTCR